MGRNINENTNVATGVIEIEASNHHPRGFPVKLRSTADGIKAYPTSVQSGLEKVSNGVFDYSVNTQVSSRQGAYFYYSDPKVILDNDVFYGFDYTSTEIRVQIKQMNTTIHTCTSYDTILVDVTSLHSVGTTSIGYFYGAVLVRPGIALLKFSVFGGSTWEDKYVSLSLSTSSITILNTLHDTSTYRDSCIRYMQDGLVGFYDNAGSSTAETNYGVIHVAAGTGIITKTVEYTVTNTLHHIGFFTDATRMYLLTNLSVNTNSYFYTVEVDSSGVEQSKTQQVTLTQCRYINHYSITVSNGKIYTIGMYDTNNDKYNVHVSNDLTGTSWNQHGSRYFRGDGSTSSINAYMWTSETFDYYGNPAAPSAIISGRSGSTLYYGVEKIKVANANSIAYTQTLSTDVNYYWYGYSNCGVGYGGNSDNYIGGSTYRYTPSTGEYFRYLYHGWNNNNFVGESSAFYLRSFEINGEQYFAGQANAFPTPYAVTHGIFRIGNSYSYSDVQAPYGIALNTAEEGEMIQVLPINSGNNVASPGGTDTHRARLLRGKGYVEWSFDNGTTWVNLY